MTERKKINTKKQAYKPKTSTSKPKSTSTYKDSLPCKNISNLSNEKFDNDIVLVIIKRHHDTKGNHPHIIIDDMEDKHVSIGLSTHPNKGKGSTNYSLDRDPLGSNKKSYMRRQGVVAPKSSYFNPQTGKMIEKDYIRAKQYGEKAKQKYLSKKDKKK